MSLAGMARTTLLGVLDEEEVELEVDALVVVPGVLTPPPAPPLPPLPLLLLLLPLTLDAADIAFDVEAIFVVEAAPLCCACSCPGCGSGADSVDE